MRKKFVPILFCVLLPVTIVLANDGKASSAADMGTVAGTYRCGEPVGYQAILVLKDNGTYTAELWGCFGACGETAGTWVIKGQSIVFTPTSEEGQMKGYLQKFDMIKYKNEWILVRPENRKIYDEKGSPDDSCFQRVKIKPNPAVQRRLQFHKNTGSPGAC